MRDFEDVKVEVIQRLDMRAVAELCSVKVRRVGVAWVCLCPFHAEKSPSFQLGGREGMGHRGHCFGCGWSGDVFAFWGELKGCDFKTALMDLARVAGVPLGEGVEWVKPDVPRVRCAAPENGLGGGEVHKVPSLPPLRHLRREECEMIAKHRGLDAEAVWVAARVFKRAAFSMWPLYEGADGGWYERSCGAVPSWCVIDETRAVAEFRRLDNAKYVRQDGGEIKAWSTCGKSWPVGAGSMGDRGCVLLVEGGPDLLAGFHFLRRWGMLDKVAVVGMLGAANRIREDALPFFKGKRVRIMVDADELKDAVKPGMRRVPGMEAAARWSGQLCEAGAAVETFCVGPVYEPEDLRVWGSTWGPMWSGAVRVLEGGLTLPSGAPVKDVNDLARCSADVLESADVREAFRVWDF